MVPRWLTGAPAGALPCPCGRRGRRRSYLEATLDTARGFLADALGGGPVGGGWAAGWLGRVDPRAKVTGVMIFLVAAGLVREPRSLLGLHLVAVLLAASAGLPVGRYLRRTWIGIPLLTALVALPATLSWVRPGEPVVWIWRGAADLAAGPFHLPGELAVTRQGLRAGLVLVLRTATSLSYVLLLTWTTRWNGICRGLRALGVPPLLVAILTMTHRYLVVLVQLVEELFTARRARPGAVAGRAGVRSGQAFVAGTVGVLLHRSEVLAGEVYEAMRARGFRGEVRLLPDAVAGRTGRADPGTPRWLGRWLFPALAALLGVAAVLGERVAGVW